MMLTTVIGDLRGFTSNTITLVVLSRCVALLISSVAAAALIKLPLIVCRTLQQSRLLLASCYCRPRWRETAVRALSCFADVMTTTTARTSWVDHHRWLVWHDSDRRRHLYTVGIHLYKQHFISVSQGCELTRSGWGVDDLPAKFSTPSRAFYIFSPQGVD